MILRNVPVIVVLAAAVAATTTALAAASPTAQPAEAAALAVNVGNVERGWIRLQVRGTPGSTLTVRETTPGLDRDLLALSMPFPSTGRKRLVPWRCDELVRTFQVTATRPDGSTEQAAGTVATPRCSKRLGLGAAKGRAGRTIEVPIHDRFRVGDISAQACAAPAGRKLVCRTVKLSAGQERRVARIPVGKRPGAYRVVVRTAFGQTLRATVAVRRVGGKFTLLAAGDSMIQIIDSFLAQRLKRQGVRVRSDDHISTGITKPAMFNWMRRAQTTARTLRPDVTVMFLGANDGFAIPRRRGGRVDCCTQEWSDLYADRVTTMMRSYLRRGAGRVYWMLLPAPRTDNFARVFRAVNRGIEQAARRFDRSEVRLIDLRRRFTPGGRYRQAIRAGGRTVSVRQPDGVHLNVKGASIAADIILAALRQDGYITQRR